MRRTLHAGVAGVALCVALALPATAMAAPAYHGEWDYENFCGEMAALSGNWNVTLQQDRTAVVHVAIFIEGERHAFWGGNAFGIPWIQREAPGVEFSLLLDDLAAPWGPQDLTFTLGDDGTLVYAFEDLCGPGVPAYLVGHVLH